MSKNINKPEDNWQKLTYRSLCEFIINLSTSGPQCKFDHPNNGDPTVIPIRDLKNIDFLDAIDLLEHDGTPLHFEYQTLSCSCHIRLALAHQANPELPATRHCVFHRAHQFAQLMKNLCQFTQGTPYVSMPEIPTDTHQDLPPIIPIDTPDSAKEHAHCLKKLHELADKLKPFNRTIEIDEEKMLVYYHNHNIPESKTNPRTYPLSSSGCRQLRMIYYNIARESDGPKNTKRQSTPDLATAENLPVAKQPTADRTNSSGKSANQSRRGCKKKAADDNCIKRIESYAAKLNQLGDSVTINYKKKSVTHTYHTRTGRPKTDILSFEKATAERFKTRTAYLRSHKSINADKSEPASATIQTDGDVAQSAPEQDHQNYIDSQASSSAPTSSADINSSTTTATLSDDDNPIPSDIDGASADSASNSIVTGSTDNSADHSPSTDADHDATGSTSNFTMTASAENSNSDVIAPPPHQCQE